MKVLKIIDADNAVVAQYRDDPEGEPYMVRKVHFFRFWRKEHAIYMFMPDTAAGGINSGGHWKRMSPVFQTQAAACKALRNGRVKTVFD